MNSAAFKTTTTAPHPDGFRGTRDASILATYDREGDFVFVQACAHTRHLLKRAEIPRPRTHSFYKVPVRYCEKVGGLQLNGKAV